MKKVESPYTAINKTYFIAHNEDNSIVHNGEVDAGVTIQTGQPVLEVTENEKDYIARCKELGIELYDTDNP